MTEKKPPSLSRPYSKYAVLSEPPVIRSASIVPPPMAGAMSLSLTSCSEPAYELVTPGAVVTPEKSLEKSYAQVDPLVSPDWVSPKGLASAEPKQEKKSDGQKTKRARSNPLTVRLSNGERELIQAKAARARCSVNAYVKTVVLGSDYKPVMDPELRKTLLALNRELTAQGRNLNQIAKQLNSGQATAIQAEIMMDVLSRSLLRTHQCVRKALSKNVEELAP